MTLEIGEQFNGIPMGAYKEGGADATAYHFKGSVDSYDDLPTDAEEGDVWDTRDTGMNYGWTGDHWDELGMNIDLSGYYDKTEIDEKFEEFRPKEMDVIDGGNAASTRVVNLYEFINPLTEVKNTLQEDINVT